MTANLQVAEWVAPGAASRWVADQWFRLPPGPRPADLPAGGTPFEVEWEEGRVRGASWGHGPIVYLVHGWGGRGDQFSALIRPLIRAGYRVVLFDAPSHGSSDPGAHGRTSTTGLEFAKALDAVFARFGPAHAVVAHSMGGLATLLALRFGWLGTDRIVLVAPMSGYAATMDGFQAVLGFGPRIRRRVDARVWKRVGLAPDEFELLSLWQGLESPIPALVVHDLEDPQTSYKQSREAAEAMGAQFVGTSGLGHNRILRDTDVVERIVGFLNPVRRQAETGVTMPATA